MNKERIIANCKEQILTACLALNMSLKTVRTLISKKEITIIENYKDNKKKIMLEIIFGNATMNCIFDENKICIGIFLFLNNPKERFYYIEYFSNNYVYNIGLNGWINMECLITLVDNNDEPDFLIIPLPTKKK